MTDQELIVSLREQLLSKDEYIRRMEGIGTKAFYRVCKMGLAFDELNIDRQLKVIEKIEREWR